MDIQSPDCPQAMQRGSYPCNGGGDVAWYPEEQTPLKVVMGVLGALELQVEVMELESGDD